jgi:hypothetical protein
MSSREIIVVARTGDVGAAGWSSLATLAADPELDQVRQTEGWSSLAVRDAPAADAFAWMAEVAADTGAPVLICAINHEDVAVMYGFGSSGQWSTYTRTGNYAEAMAQERFRAEYPDADEFDTDDPDEWHATMRAFDAAKRQFAERANDELGASDFPSAASIVAWADDAGHPEVPVEAVLALLRRGDAFGVRLLDRLLYMLGISDHVYVPKLSLIPSRVPADDWARNRDSQPPRFSV